METRTIYPEDIDTHNHDKILGYTTGGFGSTGEQDGTLRKCSCGKWFVSAPCYETFGPTSKWYKVRWFNFKLRKIIKNSSKNRLSLWS